MGQSLLYFEKLFLGNTLVDLGYRDYIAARFLLNNHFIIQGLTLASTAVEKYLKALIIFNSREKERYNYHFDKIKKLADLLSKNDPEVMKRFDPIFLEVLEKAFKIRYYDKIKDPIFIGIYINQFIGELDYTVDILERLIVIAQHGESSISPYARAIKNKDPHLFENNFVLSNQNKKEFMEKPDTGFSIHIQIGRGTQSEEIVKGKNIVNKYEGRISIFKEFQTNFFTDNGNDS